MAVRAVPGPDSTLVQLEADQPLSFTTLKLAAPPRVVIDLADTAVAGAPAEQEVGDGAVRRIAAAGAGAHTARVIIELAADVEFDVRASGTRIEVRVPRAAALARNRQAESGGETAGAGANATATPAAIPTPTSAATETVAATASEPAPEKKLFFVAGAKGTETATPAATDGARECDSTGECGSDACCGGGARRRTVRSGDTRETHPCPGTRREHGRDVPRGRRRSARSGRAGCLAGSGSGPDPGGPRARRAAHRRPGRVSAPRRARGAAAGHTEARCLAAAREGSRRHHRHRFPTAVGRRGDRAQ